ncbi:MAG: PEP-CTERM sorting domain-containing protein [Planctomycetaceae bacterium]
MSLRKTAALFAAALGFLITTTTADAAFTLEIRVNGGLVATVSDGGAGDLSAAGDGFIIVNEAASGLVIPDFNLIIDTAISNSPGGALSILTNTVNVLRTGAGSSTIELFLSAQDYVSPLLTNVLNSDITVNRALVGGEVVEFQSWADPANALFGIGAGTTTTGPQVLDNLALATDHADALFLLPGPQPDSFSITNRMRITLEDNNALVLSTADTNVNPVPEPGTMALLALGGVGLAGARWRRRKAT